MGECSCVFTLNEGETDPEDVGQIYCVYCGKELKVPDKDIPEELTMKKSIPEIIAERLGWTIWTGVVGDLTSMGYPPGKKANRKNLSPLPPYNEDLNVVMDAVLEILPDDCTWHLSSSIFEGKRMCMFDSHSPDGDIYAMAMSVIPAEAVSAALAEFIEANPKGDDDGSS